MPENAIMNMPLKAVSNEGRTKDRAADRKSKAIKDHVQAAPSVNADTENSQREKAKSGNSKAIFKVAMKSAATFTGHTVLNFDSEMKRVTDITACSLDEAEALREKARDLGRLTIFDALMVASAMAQLSEVGWCAGDILNEIDSVLNIALASGDDLITVASDTIPVIMNAFKLEPRSTKHLADVLVSSCECGKVSVEKLLEALRSTPAIGEHYTFEQAVILFIVIFKNNSRVSAEEAASALEAEALRHQSADPMTFSAVGPFPIRSKELRRVAAAVQHCEDSSAKRAAQKPTVTELLLMVKSLAKELAILFGDIIIWPVLHFIVNCLRLLIEKLRTSRGFKVIIGITIPVVLVIVLLLVF